MAPRRFAGELFSRRIAPFGVTLPMYRVMAALWEKGDQRLSDTSKGRGLVEELMPIAVHFAEVAVSSYSEDEVARLKAIFREIYERLGSIESEIEAARDSMKSRRKVPPPRPRANSRAKG